MLATNVAETSLTVPGIKYVIDPGTARISRYSYRTKVQRLPIEPISQASANQRKGRCGRVSEGICIRLYSEDDFSRPEFTDPAFCVPTRPRRFWGATALGLGDIAAFPFVEAPDKRNIQDGVRLLEELGAITTDEQASAYKLTPLGRQLSQLPVDPRLARMVLEAQKHGCVREAMIITSALSFRIRANVRWTNSRHRTKNIVLHDKESDFPRVCKSVNYLGEQQKALSSNAFRRLCRTDYLNYLRVREWQDIYTQLRQVVKELGIPVNSEPAEYREIHIALLTGLLFPYRHERCR